MEKYDSYKDSGVQWLGEIPSHWEMKRWRFLMVENTKKNSDSRVRRQLQFRYGDIVRKANQSEESDVLDTISKYIVVEPNDIMINGLNLNYDFVSQRVAQVKEEGAITSAYISLRPTNIACSRYYTYFLKSMDSKKMFHGMGTGIRLTLSYNELKNHFIPRPSIEEQEAIANYLDAATSKIDEAISQQQKAIDLLNERKQIIINNAVTKGLNPNVKMKDSGVEWIGEIPEHWEVVPIKRVVDVRDGTHDTPIYIDSNENAYPLITSKDFIDDSISYADAKWISQNDYMEIDKRSHVAKYDVLTSMIGGNIGKSVIKNDDTPIAIKNVALFRCKGDYYLSKFILFYMQGGFIKTQVDLLSRGGAQAFLGLNDMRNLVFFDIPRENMISIVKELEKQVYKLEIAVKSAMKRISFLQERKQIIINEVVTGKVKVLN